MLEYEGLECPNCGNREKFKQFLGFQGEIPMIRCLACDSKLTPKNYQKIEQNINIINYYFSGINGNSPSDFQIEGDTLVRYVGHEKYVKVPFGVKVIGKNAFGGVRDNDGCDITDEDFMLEERSKVYYCGVQYVILPEGVHTIEEGAFSFCRLLNGIKFPPTLKIIGKSAFCACDSLTKLSLPKSVEHVGEDAFLGGSLETIIIYGNTRFGKGSFGYCDRSITAKYGKEVGQIYDCMYFKKIEISSPKIEFLTSENYKAVSHNYKSSFEIIFSDSVRTIKIENRCFQNAFGLKSFNLPDKLGELIIGEYGFYGCEFEKIEFPDSLTELKIGANCFSQCKLLQEISIPDSVRKIEIGSNAFQHCEQLRNVRLPSKIKRIPDYCFFECFSLENISIPESVEKIGVRAFAKCNNLNKIMIPKGMQEIGFSAFEGAKIKSFEMRGAPKMGRDPVSKGSFEGAGFDFMFWLFGSLQLTLDDEGIENFRSEEWKWKLKRLYYKPKFFIEKKRKKQKKR